MVSGRNLSAYGTNVTERPVDTSMGGAGSTPM
jgi:hypothetical protein